MALSKKVILPNGLELNYHVISIVESDLTDTKIKVDSFMSKDFYNKAMIKVSKEREQHDLIHQFDELANKSDLTEEEESNISKLQIKINKLADDINSASDYGEYVLGETFISLRNIDDFSIDNIENQILKSNEFKSAKRVK